MVARLCDALDTIASADPRLAMVTRAFAKHLRKNPVSDDDITAALDWTEAMIYQVRYGAKPVSLVKEEATV